MDSEEATRIEHEIREEARRVALALADHPEFAIDIRDVLGERLGEISSDLELDELYMIGDAEDIQAEQGMPEHRRYRRLGELKLALDEIRGSRWPNR